MAAKLSLEVLTPGRRVLSTEAEIVVVPAADGVLGILPNHTPLVAALTIGVAKYGAYDGNKDLLAITGGLVQVEKNKVTILANAAEQAQEIDVMRAQNAKERAERRLHEHSTNIDFHRAQLALRRAVTRIRAARKEHE